MVKALSSSRLALVLVLVVILFSLAGAVLPQEGAMDPEDIAAWQKAHPLISDILQPAGLFHVFHSWAFLITIILLAVNTIACTALHFVGEGGFTSFKAPGAVEKVGFFLLHVSLVLLFVGGFWSAATRLDGHIVLTEGQHFRESHEGYSRLVEGPLRAERHQDFVLSLKAVNTKYERERYLSEVTSRIEILRQGRRVAQGAVKFNEPFQYKGMAFTQDRTGYSPRLQIRDKRSKKVLLDSFVALSTFRTKHGREYRDFLPLPFFQNRVIVTLYPSHTIEDGNLVKTGEEPENPLLLVESEDNTGNIVSRNHLLAGEEAAVDNYTLRFADLRRWSAFRVVEDSGYPVVLVALWTGLAALVLRYTADLRQWLGSKVCTIAGSKTDDTNGQGGGKASPESS
jgi:cytochrome c biogenesis protein ResB